MWAGSTCMRRRRCPWAGSTAASCSGRSPTTATPPCPPSSTSPELSSSPSWSAAAAPWCLPPAPPAGGRIDVEVPSGPARVFRRVSSTSMLARSAQVTATTARAGHGPAGAEGTRRLTFDGPARKRRSSMETRPDPWIQALRHSHETLRSLAGPLDASQLARRSYAPEWTIAQVLSHLGSQAEIFGLFLDAGLAGQDPPGRDAFPPVWEAWNAKSPPAQAADALRADQAVTERFESLDAAQ